MSKEKIIVFIIAGLFIVFILIANVSAQFSSTRSFSGSNRGTAGFVNYGSSFNRYYAGEGRLATYWPILKDPLSCEARQDILIQVSPAGCQPAVVRSDLLAEQNVPVFCQLDMLQINPAIDVKQIRNIRFKGDYPPEIAGIGFHPARAALRTRDVLLGSPVNTNIGYVVIVLKRQPDEKDLRDFLSFTVQAQVEYYSGNAIGLGRTEFLLRETTDEEWRIESNRQSFLRGQYSVRLVESDPEYIDIKLYKGDVEVNDIRIERRTASNEIYLPGFYCQTALRFNYDEFVSPDRIARIQVDEDVLDVYQGARFLNGKCIVRKITGDSLKGDVEINCEREKLFLTTKARVFGVGTEVKLLNESYNEEGGVWKIDKINDDKKTYDIKRVDNEKEVKDISFDRIKPLQGDYLIERNYGGDDKYFEAAVLEYNNLVDGYGNEKKNGNTNLESTIGEEALEKLIELAIEKDKQVTAVRLIEKYLEVYPNGQNAVDFREKLNDFYTIDSSLAGSVIDLDDGYKTIKLLSVTEPSVKSWAEIDWRGERKIVNEGSNGTFTLGEVNLIDIRSVDEVSVEVTCKDREAARRDNGRKTLFLNDNNVTVCGGRLRVSNINLEKYVKLRIEPVTRTGGYTNFTVGVGIEKRAFELTPSKAKQKIERLNESIKKWESISNNLGNVVTTLKGACFATAGVLTVKNFFTGLSGEALARQQVMRGHDGWTEKCRELLKTNGGPYDTLTQCYNAKSEEISKDVNARAKAIAETNRYLDGVETKYKTSEGGIFGGDTFDDRKAKEELLGEIKAKYSDVPIDSDRVQGVNNVSQLLEGATADSVTYQQLRDIYYNSKVYKENQGTGIGRDNANRELNTIGVAVNQRLKFERDIGLHKDIDIYVFDNGAKGNYFGETVKTLKSKGYSFGDLGDDTPVQVANVAGQNYLFVLERAGGSYVRTGTYKLNNKDIGEKIDVANLGEGDLLKKEVPTAFELLVSGSYRNSFAKGEAEVKYYETAPYQGMPAIVPFDLNNGWYAATKQTLPILGDIKAFESNGRPSSFWVCNVMKDGRVGFYSSDFGGDECVQFNFYTGQSFNKFPGLSEQETRNLVNRAVQALQEAAQQYGKKQVRILGNTLTVGNAAAIIPGTQCQDFMSPGDCKLLFNVCDPVICPASRCNLGGAYQVADVIQSGIVGSTVLCLPNIKEGVYLPVCLTGIKAGIDGYVSLLRSHQKCLQENIETGNYVGICDQISAVYMCEFFWRQAAPVANVLLPKVVELAYTGELGGTRGGGEYLTVQTAWQNAQDSVNYFTQSYAVNSIEAFKLRSIEEAGTEFCRAFITAKGPNTFKSLIEPDSPPQFHAWYTEIPFTDTTVPATSQYKLFYHIFSGNDFGTAFSVYLKDPPDNAQYRANPILVVANGFIPRGEFATESRDFTAPKGYRQLCVRINDKEECGFKQVSSSFAVNYVRDEFVKTELDRTDIISERKCISGSVNPSAFLNPNLQEAAQEAIDPAIYNRGVTRICATGNPGRGTDPTRFVDVGYCGDQAIRCWLDKNSVDNALTENNKVARETSLKELNERQKKTLEESGEFLKDEQVQVEIDEINRDIEKISAKSDISLILNRIERDLLRTFWNYHKAELLYLKGKANTELFKKNVNKAEATSVTSGGAASVSETAVGDTTPAARNIFKLNKNWIPGEKIYFYLGDTPTKLYTLGTDIKIDDPRLDDNLDFVVGKIIDRKIRFSDSLNEEGRRKIGTSLLDNVYINDAFQKINGIEINGQVEFDVTDYVTKVR